MADKNEERPVSGGFRVACSVMRAGSRAGLPPRG